MLRFCDSPSRIGGRENDANCCPFSAPAFGFYSPAVKLGDMFYNRLPEPSAAEMATSRLVSAIKSLKDPRQILLADADAGVAYSQGDFTIAALGPKMDFVAFARVFHRVVQQVVENF